MKIATIGTGFIVERFLDAVRQVEGAECYGVYSRTEEKAQNLAGKFNVEATFTDIDEMMTDVNYDIVYVASPNSLHYEYVKQALENDKHVICEKPFTSTLREMEELIALSKKKGLFLFEAITTIHLPHFKVIQDNIEKIGNLKVAQANYSQYSSRYDKLKAGETPNVFNLEFSGGALADLNIYNLHFMIGMFGGPEEITYVPNKHDNGVDTSGVSVLNYNGCFATCVGSKDTTSENFVLLQGDEGFIHVKGGANTIDKVEIHVGEDVETIDMGQNENNMVAELEAFVEIFEAGDSNAALKLLDHSATVMKFLEAARKSAGILYPADEK